MILRGIALELGKMDENVQRGGDVISDKKMSLQIFVFSMVYFGPKFWNKCLKNEEFPNKGGGSIVVWTFKKTSSQAR